MTTPASTTGGPPRLLRASASGELKKQVLHEVAYSEAVVFSKTFAVGSFYEAIIKLVFDNEDPKFQAQFLNTYRMFPNVSPMLLLETLASVFQNPVVIILRSDAEGSRFLPPADWTRLSVALLIKRWASRFWDFDDLLHSYLSVFVEAQARDSAVSTAVGSPIKVLRDVLASLAENKRRSFIDKRAQFRSKPIQVMGEVRATPMFLQNSRASPAELAEQLTLLEHELLTTIDPSELLKQEWATGDSAKAPGVLLYINWFNQMATGIGKSIIQESTDKGRALLIRRAVSIATRCLELGNYNGVMEILTGLFKYTIHLSRAWQLVSGKCFDSLVTLATLMSPVDNYSQYKQHQGQRTGPYVPFLGVMLSDLSFIDDFNVSKSPAGLNFAKAAQMSEIIEPFATCQREEYSLPVSESLREFVLLSVTSTTPITKESSVAPTLELSDTSTRAHELKKLVDECFSPPEMLWNRQLTVNDYELRSRDWKVLFTGANLFSYAPNEIIFEHGDPLLFYTVKSGQVHLERNGVVISRISAGKMFGEYFFFESSFRSDIPTCVSDTSCVVQAIDSSLLAALVVSNPHLAQRFFGHLAKDIIERCAVPLAAPPRTKLNRKKRPGELLRTRSKVVVKPQSSLVSLLPMDPLAQRDALYSTLFGLEGTHIVIKEYHCALQSHALNYQGTLFISAKYICFYAKMFNHKTKLIIQMSDLTQVKLKKGNRVALSTRKKKFWIKLKDGQDEEACRLIESIRNSGGDGEHSPQASPRATASSTKDATVPSGAIGISVGTGGSGGGGGSGGTPSAVSTSSSSSASGTPTATAPAPQSAASLELMPADWELILQGSKTFKFQKGDVVVAQGQRFQRIFQIVTGECRIEKEVDNQTVVVGRIGNGEIFGEMSFVLGSGATASVVADSEVDLFVVEGHTIARLMKVRPELGGRFMHFICSALVRRLLAHDRMETDDEKRVADIFDEPLHTNLDNVSTVPCMGRDALHQLEGPADDEDANVAQSARSWVCGRSISTYPFRAGNQVRDGDPICDRYKAVFYENLVIAAVADGCNWGNLPRQAGINASDAFVRYMTNHHSEIRNVRYAGSLILRAFAMAQAAVIGDDIDMPTGTTTLLGGIVLELDEEDESCGSLSSSPASPAFGSMSSSSSSPAPALSAIAAAAAGGGGNRPPKWGFVYGSVGDCKAFHYSAAEKHWQDITESNRALSRDPTDCGGRLGRMTATNGPDLRNFELGFFPCDAGDLIVIVSDGVHDNLDPQSLGKPPQVVGLNCNSWDEVELDEAERLKNRFRVNLLTSMLQERSDGRRLEPAAVVHKLLEYCIGVNAAAVSWMAENPTKPLPKDYVRYPGKMDHTTCLCFEVGRRSPSS